MRLRFVKLQQGGQSSVEADAIKLDVKCIYLFTYLLKYHSDSLKITNDCEVITGAT